MLDEALPEHPENHVLCVPKDVDVAALGAFIEGKGPIPEACYWEDEETHFARGRVENCTCEMLYCVCAQVVDHLEYCHFRKAMLCPIGFVCEHGVEVCSQCDPCTCLGTRAEREHMRILEESLAKKAPK